MSCKYCELGAWKIIAMSDHSHAAIDVESDGTAHLKVYEDEFCSSGKARIFFCPMCGDGFKKEATR